MSDGVIVIDEDEWNAALADPRARAFRESAVAYAAELIARGHCPVHLVVHCDCGPSGGSPS